MSRTLCTLQGSTYVNDIYGLVNRTGLLVAGAGLLGVSGGGQHDVSTQISF